jgi:hypothetical protein
MCQYYSIIPLMLLVLFVRSEIPLVATIDHIMLTEIKEGILKKIPIGGNSPKNHNPVIEIFNSH